MEQYNNKSYFQYKGTKQVFVCGAGHQGLSMAAYLSLNGVSVSLWNRTAKHIKKIIDTHQISCNGIIEGIASINKVSVNLKEVVSDFIMVTTPSSAHKDIARQLAPYVHKDMIIVLNPGRTFGAIDFAKTLKECGVKTLPLIAETQTIIYTCRKSSDNNTTIFALKDDVKIAALKGSNINFIMQRMPDCLKPFFGIVDSVALTSLSNIGMILHCAPVLMNIGWIESNKVDFKYYYDGISKTVAHFLDKIDLERILVAQKLGYHVESLVDWMRRTYNLNGSSIYECIRTNESYKEIDAPPNIRTRYLLEDVPNGLVPIEYLGKQLGVSTPNITTIINLASSVLDENFRKIGRQFSLDLLYPFF